MDTTHFWNFRHRYHFDFSDFFHILNMSSISVWRAWKEQRLVCWTRYALFFWNFDSTSVHIGFSKIGRKMQRNFQKLGAWKTQIINWARLRRSWSTILDSFRMSCTRSSCFSLGSLSNVVSQLFFRYLFQISSFRIICSKFWDFVIFSQIFWKFSFFKIGFSVVICSNFENLVIIFSNFWKFWVFDHFKWDFRW